MKANDVIKIINALNEKEQLKLLVILQNRLKNKTKVSVVKIPLITRQQADKYIFEHVFNKHK